MAVPAGKTNDRHNWIRAPSTTRSAQPGVAILPSGTIGFLYNNYDPVTNKLSQRFLETADDFATTTQTVLATETNSTPSATFSPYLGDFFDLVGIGSTFYGIFSASNADNGTSASFYASSDTQLTASPECRCTASLSWS